MKNQLQLVLKPSDCPSLTRNRLKRLWNLTSFFQRNTLLKCYCEWIKCLFFHTFSVPSLLCIELYVFFQRDWSKRRWTQVNIFRILFDFISHCKMYLRILCEISTFRASNSRLYSLVFNSAWAYAFLISILYFSFTVLKICGNLLICKFKSNNLWKIASNYKLHFSFWYRSLEIFKAYWDEQYQKYMNPSGFNSSEFNSSEM